MTRPVAGGQTELLSATELAQALSVSERTVKRLAYTGRIPRYRTDRLLRFDLDEVLRALREAPEQSA